ncbi:hypothetical protein V8C43DRAFT_104248 [Trichoderma afarasin]
MLSRVETASQRQALWEWPICSVTPGKRFLPRHVLFWPTAKLATGLAPAGAAGHDTGTRTMQSQHDSCSRLSAAPPGRSSVCLAAGEVARTSTSTSASEAKAICQVKRLQTNVPVQVSSHLITLYYHGYGPSMVLRTYEYSTSATGKVKRGRLFLRAAALSLPPTSQARHSPTMVRPARLGRTCLGHLYFARDSTPCRWSEWSKLPTRVLLLVVVVRSSFMADWHPVRLSLISVRGFYSSCQEPGPWICLSRLARHPRHSHTCTLYKYAVVLHSDSTCKWERTTAHNTASPGHPRFAG